MDGEDGAAKRALLKGSAGELYREAVEHNGFNAADDRLRDEAFKDAFDALVELGLLTVDRTGERYIPVDPEAVSGRLVSPLSRAAIEKLEESARWATTFNDLAADYRRVSSSREPFTELRGLAAINALLTSAIDDAQSELLTAQPTSGHAKHGWQEAARRDIGAVRRGVSMRTLYQHTARRSIPVQEYVDAITPHGAQVRTLDEFFNRMIVIDRRIAVIPAADAAQVAIAITEPSTVNYLVDIFDRNWQRARPFEDHAESTNKLLAEDVRKMTSRMLREGHSDQTGAKRVGVSVRTFAGYVAALKAEYGVETRFQLGYAMGLDQGRVDAGVYQQDEY